MTSAIGVENLIFFDLPCRLGGTLPLPKPLHKEAAPNSKFADTSPKSPPLLVRAFSKWL